MVEEQLLNQWFVRQGAIPSMLFPTVQVCSPNMEWVIVVLMMTVPNYIVYFFADGTHLYLGLLWMRQLQNLIPAERDAVQVTKWWLHIACHKGHSKASVLAKKWEPLMFDEPGIMAWAQTKYDLMLP